MKMSGGLFLLFMLCCFLPTLLHAQIVKPAPLPIDSTTDYLVYYGSWDEDHLTRAMDFSLVILEPSQISAADVARLKKGHDGIAGTSDDVLVFGYLSIGEDNSGNRVGNGRGPCYYDWDSARVMYENKGLAPWYVDDADHNGAPDVNGSWGSFYVNAGDSTWWQFLKSNANGADHTLTVLNCDGLFLDTIDSASPWSIWPYRWTVVGMSDLIAWLRAQYPTKYLFGNRGLFYFDPIYATAYAHTIRPFVDAIMYESYFLDGSRSQWAAKINTEAHKADGFKVVALDYFVPGDSAKIAQQTREVFGLNWGDYISASSLDQIRYDVYHRHTPDRNPPTWNNSIGVAAATPSDKAVTIRWNAVTDQSLPVGFNIYYGTQSPLTLAGATKIPMVSTKIDTTGYAYSFTVGGLTNFTKYSFVVRAVDALGHEDQNFNVTTATPPNGSSSSMTIDGSFGDWDGIPALNISPNTADLGSDTTTPDADFTGVWASNDSSRLYVSYQVKGAITGAYFYHIFFDLDETRSTGFTYQDSALAGAEFMVENSNLFKYTGTGGTNWGWTSVAGMNRASTGGRTEMSIPFSALGIVPSSALSIRLLFQDNLAVSPFSLVDIAPRQFAQQCYRYSLQGTTSVGELSRPTPSGLRLDQNFPNPFNPTTTLRYAVPRRGMVNLAVYDILGRKVTVLVNGEQEMGTREVRFDGSGLASGAYLCRLEAGGLNSTKVMMLVK